MRITSGQRSRTIRSNSTPSIPGMRTSVTITSNGRCSISVDGARAVLDEDHFPLRAQRVQPDAQSIEQRGFVVDEQHALHAGSGAVRAVHGQSHDEAGPDARASSARRSARHACRLTIDRAMASPCPVPRPTAFVVKKGSKIFSRFSGAMPQPLSAMATSTNSPARSRADGDAAVVRILAGVLDRMGRIHDEVQKHLVELADVAHHRRQLAEVGLYAGGLLVFAAGDRERGAQRVIQIGRALFDRVRICKFLHRTDDGRNAIRAVKRALDRRGISPHRNSRSEAASSCLTCAIDSAACGRSASSLRAARCASSNALRSANGRAQKVHAIADILDRRIDLVREACRESSDRFELLGQPQLLRHPLALAFGLTSCGDVGAQRDVVGDLPELVAQR